MAAPKAEQRIPRSNDPIRAGRKALDIAQLCTLRPLPDPVIAEFDAPLVTLLQAAEGAIRAKVALRLAGCSWAPREAVRMLAFEPLDISEPVLARSPVITEEDLLQLAGADAEHRLLIARRPRVSEPVSAAIAKYRETNSLMALASNEGAELADRSAPDFAAIAKADESLQTALAQRTDLGAKLAHAIFAIAGETVKQTLLATYPDLARAQLEVAVEDAVENPAGSDLDASAVTEELERSGALTKADALRAARNGRSDIADHAVARLTGLPATDWRRALSRSPLRVCLLAGRAMAMSCEEACALYVAFADIGRAHPVTPDALATASAQIYEQFARDDARHALHRLGAGGSIG
jgi:uncharacterized protein (DUF2336 family)